MGRYSRTDCKTHWFLDWASLEATAKSRVEGTRSLVPVPPQDRSSHPRELSNTNHGQAEGDI